MSRKTAVIIGAGPAGLTAAYELLEKTDIKPVIYEMEDTVGGISRTVAYKGNRIDIGGHRFFSKSDRVMRWWQRILPLQTAPSKDDLILKRNVSYPGKGVPADPEKADGVMLLRNRISRIFFLRKFFNYPLSLNYGTFANLGIKRVVKIALSYFKINIFPVKNEKNLEDFFINRFGEELYSTFFKDYTLKVWGIPCDEIGAEWGAQRIQGLSITRAITDVVKSLWAKSAFDEQKNVETSLIKQFMYPKLGPGQLWEKVAQIVIEKGGEIHLKHKLTGIKCDGGTITEAIIRDEASNNIMPVKADYFFSTMPVRDLISAFGPAAPEKARKTAEGLVYRDFITVGLLAKKLKIKNMTDIPTINGIVPDNWIYIQEKEVKIGRLQIFNNWSPYLVSDINNVWVGLEYFCNEGDGLWNKKDSDFMEFAAGELSKIDILEKEDVMDGIVLRFSKVYPAYFGTYNQFNLIRDFVDTFGNLFLIGRNGMHRYNNMDHSMLSAMTAVENIINGVKSKDAIWATNSETEYHEKK